MDKGNPETRNRQVTSNSCSNYVKHNGMMNVAAIC